MSSLREEAIANLLSTVAVIDGIRGAIDEVPFDYRKPPLPRPGFGKAYHPYAYIFDGEELPTRSEEYHGFYYCDLPVTVEVTFEYSATSGDGLKQKGRAILAAIQRGVMADPSRGGVAMMTLEDRNAIEETAAELLGVVVWQGRVQYLRALTDPASRDGMM